MVLFCRRLLDTTVLFCMGLCDTMGTVQQAITRNLCAKELQNHLSKKKKDLPSFFQHDADTDDDIGVK